jgi:hypothetical protein
MFFTKRKDGGPESKVWGYWLVELKWLFSVALLMFARGSREAFHSHAFNAVSWVLRGQLRERLIDGTEVVYKASWRPVWTPRERLHQVFGEADRTWVLTFRGPWVLTWIEMSAAGKLRLTHGRRIVS